MLRHFLLSLVFPVADWKRDLWIWGSAWRFLNLGTLVQGFIACVAGWLWYVLVQGALEVLVCPPAPGLCLQCWSHWRMWNPPSLRFLIALLPYLLRPLDALPASFGNTVPVPRTWVLLWEYDHSLPWKDNACEDSFLPPPAPPFLWCCIIVQIFMSAIRHYINFAKRSQRFYRYRLNPSACSHNFSTYRISARGADNYI